MQDSETNSFVNTHFRNFTFCYIILRYGNSGYVENDSQVIRARRIWRYKSEPLWIAVSGMAWWLKRPVQRYLHCRLTWTGTRVCDAWGRQHIAGLFWKPGNDDDTTAWRQANWLAFMKRVWLVLPKLGKSAPVIVLWSFLHFLFDRLIDDGTLDAFEQVVFHGSASNWHAAAAHYVLVPMSQILIISFQATLDTQKESRPPFSGTKTQGLHFTLGLCAVYGGDSTQTIRSLWSRDCWRDNACSFFWHSK